jgi:signal-transduction protein with cAMP-binding, CBS, and nucleotidyltransferase domain
MREEYRIMATVKHLVNSKTDSTHYAVKANETVLKALRIMTAANIGSVLVMEEEKIIGIFTERDYLQKGELQGRTAAQTTVREVMTDAMYTVTTETSTDECMAVMMKLHIRHLPVVENGILVGIISMRDVVAAAVDERETKIKGLEDFIRESGFRR